MSNLRPTVLVVLTVVFATTALGLAMVPGCGARWTPPGYHERWDLKGKHEGLPCESCHPVGEPLAVLPTACASCHEPDRPANHYEGDCIECHDENGWDGATPDHSFFPLVDRHDIACVQCHGDFSQDLDPTCSSCHESERPTNHFPTLDCAGCHTPTRWGDAHVAHDFFPLTNSHDRDCADCHGTSGDFTGLDPTCSSCHEPERPAGHFAGECDRCHDTTRWEDASFDHSEYFPIPHRGVGTCTSCHPAGYQTFVCTDCHEHNRTNTDEHHKEVRDYSYDSAACLRCHPDGRH